MKNLYSSFTKYVLDIVSRYSVKQEDVVGVDITPNFIRVAQLSEDKNGWILDKVGYKFVSDASELSDIVTHQATYVERLKELVDSSNLDTTNAAISIPITSAIVRTVTLPLMTEAEIQSAIEYDSLWNNVIQLDEKLEEYSIFWQVIRRNTAANTMELLFVASKLSEINHYVQIATKAGLNPVVVDVRCFAIRNALKTMKGGNFGTTAIIEFGPNENYVLIVTNDTPFIYDIYVSDADKELLKLGAPKDVWPEEGKRAKDKFYDRYADQVRQAFRAYEAKVGQNIIDKVLIVSPMQDLGDLLPQLKASLDGYNITVFDPTSTIQVPLNLQEKIDGEPNKSIFSSALGLATRKVDIFGYYKYVTGVNNVNLLPNRETVKGNERKKIMAKIYTGLGIAAVLVFIGISVVWQFSSDEALTPLYQKATQLEQDVATREAILAKLKAQKAQYAQMLDTSNALKSNQKTSYELLLAVANSVPGGVWFSDITLDGTTLTIKGEAANDQAIVSFVERLQTVPTVTKASLQTMNLNAQMLKSRRGGAKQFEIRCVIVVPQEQK